MRAARLAFFGASLSSVLWSAPSMAAEDLPSCAATIRLNAPSPAAVEIREALAGGDLASVPDSACATAAILVVENDSGWVVTLELDEERVEREVSDLGAAAVWVESWLAPSVAAGTFDESPSERTEVAPASQVPAAPASDPQSDRPTPAGTTSAAHAEAGPAAHISLLGVGDAGDDRSLWAGGEFAARLQLTPSIWLGAALGGSRDTVVAGEAADGAASRQAFRASARGGMRAELGRSSDVVVGVGAGVISGTAEKYFGRELEDTQHGGLFAELFADVSYALTPRLSVLGGVGVRGHDRALSDVDRDDQEALVPPAIPGAVGELRLGVGYRFGGRE